MSDPSNDYRTTWTVPVNMDSFVRTCAAAASNEQEFSNFRSSVYIQQVIETRPPDWNHIFLNVIDNCRLPTDILSVAAVNDRIGSPVTSDVRGHRLAPTTLAYAMDAAVLYSLFGSLEGMRIAEIGGGYGGFASIACRLWNVDYTIYDIPEALALQSRYLQATGCRQPTLRHEVVADGFDLVVSNCALSELSIDHMNTYMNSVLRPSKRGFIGWNNVNTTPWIAQTEWGFGWLSRYLHPTRVSWGLLNDGHMKCALNFAPYQFWWGE